MSSDGSEVCRVELHGGRAGVRAAGTLRYWCLGEAGASRTGSVQLASVWRWSEVQSGHWSYDWCTARWLCLVLEFLGVVLRRARVACRERSLSWCCVLALISPGTWRWRWRAEVVSFSSRGFCSSSAFISGMLWVCRGSVECWPWFPGARHYGSRGLALLLIVSSSPRLMWLSTAMAVSSGSSCGSSASLLLRGALSDSLWATSRSSACSGGPCVSLCVSSFPVRLVVHPLSECCLVRRVSCCSPSRDKRYVN